MDFRRLLECFAKIFLIFDDSYIDFTPNSKITVHPKQYLEKFDHEFNYEGNCSMRINFQIGYIKSM